MAAGSEAPGVDVSGGYGAEDQFGERAHAELLHDVAAVCDDRREADVELLGDLLVDQAAGQQREHLRLAVGQGRGSRPGRSGGCLGQGTVVVRMGAVVHAVGADAIGSFVARAGLWQPVLAGLVGLVPNCAASILLTQLYAAGQLSFAGAVAGLSISAGVGLAVLFRANKSVKQNVFIVGLLYVLGVCAGMVAGLFG